MKQKKIGTFTQLTAENGYIHKIGTDTYCKSLIMLSQDSLEDYEEVDEIPSYTKSEYDNKVNELIRERYTQSEENALKRKIINTLLLNTLSEDTAEHIIDEYSEFNTYVEHCKVLAKDSNLYLKQE